MLRTCSSEEKYEFYDFYLCKTVFVSPDGIRDLLLLVKVKLNILVGTKTKVNFDSDHVAKPYQVTN
jgi:hypothetical protein